MSEEENLKALNTPEEQLEAIRAGELAQAVQKVLGEIDASLLEDLNADALSDSGKADDDLAVEYTRLFDVGGSGGPSCSLWGGTYGDARMKTMEEAVRFYNHFGLSVSEDPHELPDHLTTQLEFLHYLAYRETEALQKGEDPGAFRRAQRDFLMRHPGKWIPTLSERIQEQKAMPLFVEIGERLVALLKHDQEHLVDLVGKPPVGQSGGSAAPSFSMPS